MTFQCYRISLKMDFSKLSLVSLAITFDLLKLPLYFFKNARMHMYKYVHMYVFLMFMYNFFIYILFHSTYNLH